MISENVAIVHSGPILAAIIAVPILGEKLGINRSIAIIVGFIGVLIIVKPGTDLFKFFSIFQLVENEIMRQIQLEMIFSKGKNILGAEVDQRVSRTKSARRDGK